VVIEMRRAWHDSRREWLKSLTRPTAAIRCNYRENRKSLQGDLEWLSRSSAFVFEIS
jgi:hypothetical protein